MKLKFTRKKNGEISLTINDKDFNTDDYLKIIKEIYNGNKIELDDFDDSITEEEQASIKKMIEKINSIKDESLIDETEENDDADINGENINSDSIPF
jgi:uncharacterized protein (DUF2344 family)